MNRIDLNGRLAVVPDGAQGILWEREGDAVTPAVACTPILDQRTPEHIGDMPARIPMNRFLEPDEAAC